MKRATDNFVSYSSSILCFNYYCIVKPSGEKTAFKQISIYSLVFSKSYKGTAAPQAEDQKPTMGEAAAMGATRSSAEITAHWRLWRVSSRKAP